jgi:hypothetical protein
MISAGGDSNPDEHDLPSDNPVHHPGVGGIP